MLTTNPYFSYRFYFDHSRVKSDYYESFSSYVPTSEFLRKARDVLPFSWSIQPMGLWTHVSPPHSDAPKQGWKIHVSATHENHLKILEHSIQVCVDCEVSFKFLGDPFIFDNLLGKGGAREASGKFITIYPSDDSHFKLIADALCEKLSEFEGPYILSDKPYRDSQVVFYRYGAFLGYPRLSIFGYTDVLLRSPEGVLVPDGRSAFFNPPPWVSDPFDLGETNEADVSPITTIYLKEGRYRIEEAMQFSLTGGVYKAVDLDSGKTVVIKEARPNTSVEPNGSDAVDRLEKEHRLLTKLSGSGITPEPIDIFFDWKHLFLVEEFILGEPFLNRFSLFDVHSSGHRFNPEIYIEMLYTLWTQMAYAVKTAHDHNILINDFSPGNIIFSNQNETLHLIDLEAACEEGVDTRSQNIRTIGFRSQENLSDKLNDIYGLGALIFHFNCPINPVLELEPNLKNVFLADLEKDGHISRDLRELLLKCLDTDKKNRPTASDILNRLENISLELPPVVSENCRINDTLIHEKLNKTLSYIKSNMSFHRKDRLFPSDPTVFITNPLSIAHGAAGVAYTLSAIEGEVPDKVISWMLTHEISKDTYPPGLYLGLSGIAWVFWELGLKEVALKLMRMAANHALLWELSDIYYGAAGFGLACLYFHKETSDAYWLEQAVRVGNKLIQTKAESENGLYWPDMEGNVWSGYARGASGISLFLLYLHFASGDTRFLNAGRRALDYDLGETIALDDVQRVPKATSDSIASPHQNIYSYYWSEGTAGICTTLLRYISIFEEQADKDMLERLIPDTTRDNTAFPTLFTGLAGLGNLQLDAFHFTGDTKYVESAFYITRGLLRFQIEKPHGIAFPGEQHLRISNDFGSGAAGIAMFMHRLLNREPFLPNFNFMLDELLCGKKSLITSSL